MDFVTAFLLYFCRIIISNTLQLQSDDLFLPAPRAAAITGNLFNLI